MRFLVTTIISTLLFFISSTSGYASCSNSDLSITLTTAPSLTLDSNSPCDGPHAGYTGYEVCNTSANTIYDIEPTLSNFSNTTAAGTDGVTYGLGGNQAATQYYPALDAGECATFYWFIAYPCVDGETTNFDIDFNFNDGTTGSACNASFTESLTTNSEISANSGGLLNSQVVSGDGVVGSITSACVQFSFGTTKVGDEFNLQPAANLDYNAECFQLINSEITSSVIPGINVGDQDQLYFIATGNKNGSSNIVDICYYFKNLCADPAASTLNPFASQTGGNQVKYSGNYGDSSNGDNIFDTTLPSGGDPLSIEKTTPQSVVNPGDTVSYTITITNTSTISDVSFDEIIDQTPVGFTFVSTEASTSTSIQNALIEPTTGDVGTIAWKGGATASVFPYTDFYIPAGTTLTLEYKLRVPDDAIAGANHDNDVQYRVGNVYGQTSTASVTIFDIFAPVSLAAFKAQVHDESVLLTWKTESEINNDFFIIEHSTNAYDFKQIGFVKGIGNSETINYYDFLDANPTNGNNYYRLVQTDFDGQETYSEIVHAKIEKENSIAVYPTITSKRVKIEFANQKEHLVSLFDLHGKMLEQYTFSETLNTIDLSTFPNASYIIQVQNVEAQSIKSFKIIKQ